MKKPYLGRFMEVNPAYEVVNLIRANVLRIRTGLWLAPAALLGQERNEAARLMVDAVDLREVLLQRLPVNSRFIGLTDQKLIELLDEVTEQEGQSDCALVYNLDILLARLQQKEIRYFWQYVIEFMPHRSRALLLKMPASANELLPMEGQFNLLAREHRLANTTK
jgi:hypothetical protein